MGGDARRRLWAVIPAAGIGRRMAADRPKQYLDLAGRPVIEWSLRRLLGHPRVDGVVVAVADDDGYWPAVSAAVLASLDPAPASGPGKTLHRVPGGAERCHSVLSALDFLSGPGGPADADDRVLVHDAVRPCLTEAELDRLLETGLDHPHGALLAMPVRDTLKRGNGAGVEATVDRDGLWHAQTPQLFPLRLLRDALTAAVAAGTAVTDEAQAVEAAGGRPLLVEGEATNLKVTHQADLRLAAAILNGGVLR